MKIIWIIGSMGSGKTTQNKNLMSVLGQGADYEVIKGAVGDVNHMLTKAGPIASIGLLKPGVQTCGIDPVYSLLKKEGLLASLEMAYELDCDYVIMEGAQCSHEWHKQVVNPFLLKYHKPQPYPN